MANVGFKLGLQSAVDELLLKGTAANAVPGSFYLTSDTHRLYIGNADKSLSPVNQGVLTVDKISAATGDAAGTTYLPTAATAEQTGGFYYVKSGNILCVATGGKWVQINATRDIQSVEDVLVADENEVAVQTKVSVGSSETDVTVKSDSFTIQGGGSAHITSDAATKTITVTGDKYALSAADATATNTVDVKLTSDTAADSSLVSLKGGSNVTISQENDIITIASSYVDTNTDTSTTSASFIKNTSETTNKTGFTLSIGQTQTDVTGKLSDVVVDPVTAVLDPKIQIGATEDGKKSIQFVDGTAVLDVYTKDELEDSLKALNAMTYRGTVGQNGSVGYAITVSDGVVTGITDSNGDNVVVSIGDTFLASSDLKQGSVSIKSQSLLIATGTENENGVITSNLHFDIVESTSDKDTTYTLKGDDGNQTISLMSHAGSVTDTVNSIKFVGDSSDTAAGISIAQVTPENGDTTTVTVSHETVTQNNTTGTGVIYTVTEATTADVITGVTVDANGHITGVETSTLDLPEISSTSTHAVAVENNAATITESTVINSITSNGTQDPKEATTSSFVIESSSLTLTESAGKTNGVTVDLVWGSF